MCMYSVRLKKVKLQKFLLKNLHGKNKCSTFAEKLEKAVSVRFDSVRRHLPLADGCSRGWRRP